MIFMFSLKPSAYFRPVWYTLSRMSTVTCKPVRVVAFSINGFTNSTLVKITPRHAGQMREQPMLDRVVLGGIRRVVRHPDLHPDPIDQPLQVLLE